MDSILQSLQTLGTALKNTPAEPTALSLEQWQQLCDAHILTLENQLTLLSKLLPFQPQNAEALETMYRDVEHVLQEAVRYRPDSLPHHEVVATPLEAIPTPHLSKNRHRAMHRRQGQSSKPLGPINQSSKRKGVEGEIFALIPTTKRLRTQSEPPSAPPSPTIEYEDISEEVEQRIKQREETRRWEKQGLEKGTMRKRARDSYEGLQDIEYQEGATAPPSAKKVKERHDPSDDEAQKRSTPTPSPQKKNRKIMGLIGSRLPRIRLSPSKSRGKTTKDKT